MWPNHYISFIYYLRKSPLYSLENGIFPFTSFVNKNKKMLPINYPCKVFFNIVFDICLIRSRSNTFCHTSTSMEAMWAFGNRYHPQVRRYRTLRDNLIFPPHIGLRRAVRFPRPEAQLYEHSSRRHRIISPQGISAAH